METSRWSIARDAAMPGEKRKKEGKKKK